MGPHRRSVGATLQAVRSSGATGRRTAGAASGRLCSRRMSEPQRMGTSRINANFPKQAYWRKKPWNPTYDTSGGLPWRPYRWRPPLAPRMPQVPMMAPGAWSSTRRAALAVRADILPCKFETASWAELAAALVSLAGSRGMAQCGWASGWASSTPAAADD